MVYVNALLYFALHTDALPCPQTDIELLELGHEGNSQKTEVIKIKNFVFWPCLNSCIRLNQLEWGDSEVFKPFSDFILQVSHD